MPFTHFSTFERFYTSIPSHTQPSHTSHTHLDWLPTFGYLTSASLASHFPHYSFTHSSSHPSAPGFYLDWLLLRHLTSAPHTHSSSHTSPPWLLLVTGFYVAHLASAPHTPSPHTFYTFIPFRKHTFHTLHLFTHSYIFTHTHTHSFHSGYPTFHFGLSFHLDIWLPTHDPLHTLSILLCLHTLLHLHTLPHLHTLFTPGLPLWLGFQWDLA